MSGPIAYEDLEGRCHVSVKGPRYRLQGRLKDIQRVAPAPLGGGRYVVARAKARLPTGRSSVRCVRRRFQNDGWSVYVDWELVPPPKE